MFAVILVVKFALRLVELGEKSARWEADIFLVRRKGILARLHDCVRVKRTSGFCQIRTTPEDRERLPC